MSIGEVLKKYREKNNMTQVKLAQLLNVSNKTISKWERGYGYPDITMIHTISSLLKISVNELLSGLTVENSNISSNILKMKFYVCPICGNIIHSVGECVISCHGITLNPCIIKEMDDHHKLSITKIEDDYFVDIHHDMKKEHYISFVCGLSMDSLQFVKLYPESNAQTRLKIRGVRKIYFYCTNDGLYFYDIKKMI